MLLDALLIKEKGEKSKYDEGFHKQDRALRNVEGLLNVSVVYTNLMHVAVLWRLAGC